MKQANLTLSTLTFLQMSTIVLACTGPESVLESSEVEKELELTCADANH